MVLTNFYYIKEKYEKIAIFRNQLFKNSESFITNQANSIVNYNIVYLGRKRLGTNSSNNMDMVISDLKGNVLEKRDMECCL